jgi:hypothetical protein
MPTKERSSATAPLVVSSVVSTLSGAARSVVVPRRPAGLSCRFDADLHLRTVRVERAEADALAARVVALAAARAPAPCPPPGIDLRDHSAASENWLG